MHRGRLIWMNTQSEPTQAETITVSLEHEAAAADVLNILADPQRIPSWAPKFAERVEHHDGAHWIAHRGTESVPFTFTVHPDAGTVDILREAPDGSSIFGARLRTM